MASPFPGMDPFLESPAHWPDFHARFFNYWCEAVADLLPANYSARIGERMYLVDRPANGTPASEVRETYIEILHRPDRTLVAVLELLSPANKEQPGRGTYLTKRNALLRQEVHLVELDRLMGGQRLPMRVSLPTGHYYAFVARADRRPDCQVYAWTLPLPLPTFPIPL